MSGTELVAAVAWPVSQGTAEGIVAFVTESAISLAEIRQALRKRLPAYMVPTSVRAIELNASQREREGRSPGSSRSA